MIIAVDPSHPLPVYEQVREQIRRMVASGTLAEGAQLPTIRQLAADLGLAKGTIERAYELLELDGVISRQGRRGTHVNATGATSPTAAADLNKAAEQLVIVARQMGLSQDAATQALHQAWQAL